MTMIVVLSQDVSRLLRDDTLDPGPLAASVSSIEDALRDYGRVLTPLHPDTDDPKLSTYFTLDVRDQTTADEIIARLRRLPAVEAAYWKPSEETP